MKVLARKVMALAADHEPLRLLWLSELVLDPVEFADHDQVRGIIMNGQLCNHACPTQGRVMALHSGRTHICPRYGGRLLQVEPGGGDAKW